MLKKLLQGFVFGVGFSLAVGLAYWIVISVQLSSLEKSVNVSNDSSATYSEQQEWRELNETEKISKISVLVLLRFEVGSDDRRMAIVDRVIAKDSSISAPYKVGDRVEKSDYYPEGKGYNNRNGVLLMYVDSPPKEIEGAFLYGDKLVAYGDMPLDIFLKKFNR